MNNCKGIFGLLFGHSFKAVYDTQEEYKSTPDQQKILKAVESFNFWALSMDQITPGKNILLLKSSKIYKGQVCKRCGKFMKDEKTDS